MSNSIVAVEVLDERQGKVFPLPSLGKLLPPAEGTLHADISRAREVINLIPDEECLHLAETGRLAPLLFAPHCRAGLSARSRNQNTPLISSFNVSTGNQDPHRISIPSLTFSTTFGRILYAHLMFAADATPKHQALYEAFSEYIHLHGETYWSHAFTIAQSLPSPSPQCTACVCIPVDGTRDASAVGDAIEQYVYQTAPERSFEVIALIYFPEQMSEDQTENVERTRYALQSIFTSNPGLAGGYCSVVLQSDQPHAFAVKLLNDVAAVRYHIAAELNEEMRDPLLIQHKPSTFRLPPGYIDAITHTAETTPRCDLFVGAVLYPEELRTSCPGLYYSRVLEMRLARLVRHLADAPSVPDGNLAVRLSSLCMTGGFNPIAMYPMTEFIDRNRLMRSGATAWTQVSHIDTPTATLRILPREELRTYPPTTPSRKGTNVTKIEERYLKETLKKFAHLIPPRSLNAELTQIRSEIANR